MNNSKNLQMTTSLIELKPKDLTSQALTKRIYSTRHFKVMTYQRKRMNQVIPPIEIQMRAKRG